MSAASLATLRDEAIAAVAAGDYATAKQKVRQAWIEIEINPQVFERESLRIQYTRSLEVLERRIGDWEKQAARGGSGKFTSRKIVRQSHLCPASLGQVE